MRLFLSIILIFSWSLKGINAQNTGYITKKFVSYKEAIILPKKDNNYLLTRELEAHRPGRPIHFAVADTVKSNVNNSGVWTSPRSNKETWTLEIESEGALSINLGFKKFQLPEQTELYIYDETKSYYLGPFTNQDNEEHQQLWTPIIKGDKVILELHTLTSLKEEILLELTYVNHDFLGFGNSFSGSCNLDVICGGEDGFEEVDKYRDIIRSVGAYHINGVSTCSGALVNNTRQDKRPFFLTAEHCDITTSNAPTIVSYWNYENSFCRTPFSSESGQVGNGNLNQFNTGSILRAKNENTDFCLIEFDDPVRPEYNPYYSGWEREFTSTDMAICIHHPGVEEKRISFEMDEVLAGVDDFITVSDWDIGTTEGGSSGAPLYTEDKKIIGQLEGGLAACTNNLSDSYGNFGASWIGSGTPSTSLRFWLDPDNLDISSINGFEGNFGLDITNNFQEFCSLNKDTLIIEAIVENTFTNFVNIEVDNLPDPLQLISIEENITPGMSTQLVFSMASGLQEGEYTITLISSDGVNSVQNEFTFTVDQVIPSMISPLLPLNGFLEARNEQLLSWAESIENRYHLQVSTSSDFMNLFVDNENISSTNFNVENLINETTYYWRVRAVNNCGGGNWSQTFQFRTQITYCLTVESENEPTEIPSSGSNDLRFNIIFEYPAIVDKIRVDNVNLEHEYINDLDLELYNPENLDVIVLLSQICNNQDNMNLGFSDSGTPNLPCPPIDGRDYQSDDPLRNVNDINAQGVWELLVRDNVDFDGGVFNSWKLEVCFSDTQGKSLINLDEHAVACVGGQAQISFFYKLDGETINEISLENEMGIDIPIEPILLPLEESGELKVTILDNDLLNDGVNELYLSFNNTIEELFFIELITEPVVDLDLFFDSGETIASLDQIDWVGTYAESYEVEISLFEDFSEILWASTQSEEVNSIAGPTLEDGDYYLRVLGINDCGTNSSDLYNFSIDESVSILESTKKPLLISQSLSRDEILISGNTDNAHISVAVISISGHKLLSQNSKEASLLLDITALIPGVYFLELKSEEVRTIKKIVVY